MSWLKRALSEDDPALENAVQLDPTITPLTPPGIQEFKQFILERLPLSGLGSIRDPSTAKYWIVDQHKLRYKPDDAKEKIADILSRLISEQDREKIMAEGLSDPSTIFDLDFYQKEVRPDTFWPELIITWQGQPLPVDMTRFQKLLSFDNINVYSEPPAVLQRMHQDREERRRQGFQAKKRDQTLVAPAFAEKIKAGELPNESILRYVNLAGYLCANTVVDLDTPQVKLVELARLSPDIMQRYQSQLLYMDDPATKRQTVRKRKNLPPAEQIVRLPPTLRNLPDDIIREIYTEFYYDLLSGENNTGLNLQEKTLRNPGNDEPADAEARRWAYDGIMDRRSHQTHLNVTLKPPHVSVPILQDQIGIRTDEFVEENPQWADMESQELTDITGNVVIAGTKQVDNFRQFLNLDYEVIPLSERQDIDSMESFGRGVSNVKYRLSDKGAIETSKQRILESVDPGQADTVEFFFDMGADGNVDFQELLGWLQPGEEDRAASSGLPVFTGNSFTRIFLS